MWWAFSREGTVGKNSLVMDPVEAASHLSFHLLRKCWCIVNRAAERGTRLWQIGRDDAAAFLPACRRVHFQLHLSVS